MEMKNLVALMLALGFCAAWGETCRLSTADGGAARVRIVADICKDVFAVVVR